MGKYILRRLIIALPSLLGISLVLFVLLALGFHRATRSLAFLRRNGRYIEVAGGLLLVAMGVLFVSGQWQQLFRPLQRWYAQFGWPPV